MGVKIDPKSMVQALGRMEVPFTEMGHEGWKGQWGTARHLLCWDVHWDVH